MSLKTISLNSILFFTLLILTSSSHLRHIQSQSKSLSLNKQNPIDSPQDLFYKNATEAVDRILDRVQYLYDTSCKVAAKFILLALSNIHDKKELPIMKLSSDYKTNLKRIREKLDQGKILQIEIKPNHHFVIFKKNDKELFLLNAFQGLFKLSDWVHNDKIMKPYLTIDEFFDKMELMLDPYSTIEDTQQMEQDLFMPNFFICDKEKQKKLKKWFGKYMVNIVKVNYVDFDFGVKYDDNRFRELFHKVDYSYRIF